MFRFRAKLIELFKRPVQYDKTLKIYLNGFNNEYPERIERLTNNSVTAKQCSNMLSQFLAGKGWGKVHNAFMVNKDLSLLEFTHKLSQSIARQRGYYVHLNYNLNREFTSIDVLPFVQCRIGKKDDEQYNGKIAISKDWQKPDDKDNKPILIDVFNSNKEVIEAQFEEYGEDGYKGQVLFKNMDYNTDYPYATIDAVQEDCDSEMQASIYKNRGLRKGFFGKTLVITPPMTGAKPEQNAGETIVAKFNEQVNERQKFRDAIKDFIGAENNSGILHIEMEYDSDEGIDKVILFKNIEANIDDKLFAYTETSVSNNIRFAHNNIPSILVREEGGKMFGSSGESIREAKLFYFDQTTMERMMLIKTITDLMGNFAGFKGELKYEPLIEAEKDKKEEKI